MDQQDQINSVIVKINMDRSETDPRFVVQEVTAQPGRCFEGAENLHRARFQCLGCTVGYVMLPLIMQTAPNRTEMEVSIAENHPTPNKKVVEYFSEDENGSTLNKTIDSDEEQTQGDGLVDSETKADTAFPMGVDADYVETPPVKNQVRFDQSSDSEECEVLTSSEELSLKLQCLQSEVVIRLVRVDEEARKESASASVVPLEPQERNVKGFYQCDICKVFFIRRHGLIQHLNIHMGIRYSCSECQRSFNLNSDLAMHKKRWHQIEFRICEVCGWNQTCTNAVYHLHLRRRHPEFYIYGRQTEVQNFNGVDFPCIYCEPQATFKSFEELKGHIGFTHDRKFACTRCPKAYAQKYVLNDHIESNHENKKFNCPKCDHVFAWRMNLYDHLRNHE